MIRAAIAFVLLASIACATRRDAAPQFEHLDECPNPIRESMSWLLVEGRVVEVKSARTFRLLPDRGHVMTVTLANVGEPADPGAMALLQRMIAGKRVSVMRRMSIEAPDEEVLAEVHNEKGRDISRELLRAGAVAFVVAPAYTLSEYSECLHRIAEGEAKAERAGIWRR